jgi:putative membrane protein
MDRRSLLLALGGLAFAGTAFAKPMGMGMDTFRTADLAGGEFAMRSSQIALTKITNPDVANFANAEIAEQVNIASALGATPGMSLVRADRLAVLTKLQDIPAGPAFNAMYVNGQISGHRELLTLNSSYLRTGSDPQFLAVVNMSLPLIQQHLAVLNSLRNMA